MVKLFAQEKKHFVTWVSLHIKNTIWTIKNKKQNKIKTDKKKTKKEFTKYFKRKPKKLKKKKQKKFKLIYKTGKKVVWVFKRLNVSPLPPIMWNLLLTAKIDKKIEQKTKLNRQ